MHRTQEEFDEDFYEEKYPQTKGYSSGMTKRERLLMHYELYGREQGLCRNRGEFEERNQPGIKDIVADPEFDEIFYEKFYPMTKDFYQPFCKDNGIDDKRRLFYHYRMYNREGYRNKKEFSLVRKKYLESNESLIDLCGTPKQDRVVLHTQFFKASAEVTSNNIYCLYKNLDNPMIDQIVLFVEEDSRFSPVFGDKLVTVPIRKRLSYRDWYDFSAKNSPDSIKVLANSDIYFDETIETLRRIRSWPEDMMYACSRKDMTKAGKIRRSRELFTKECPYIMEDLSQDCWAFKNPLLDFEKEYSLGYMHCDTMLRESLGRSGMRMANLFLHMNCIHVDWRSKKQRPEYDKNS